MGTEQRTPLAWVAQNFRERGFIGALEYYSEATLEFLRDLAPQRRRSRYGDIDYDFEHNVDTTWATVSWRTRLRELMSGAKYQASEPTLFREILQSIPARLDGYTFIDLGSGKGRTLLMASEYPFRRIIGLELLPELNEIAQQNIARFQSEHQQCSDILSMAGDAREYQFPCEPIVLYLFNPFPEAVLRRVLAHLHDALQSRSRECFLVYHNLVYESVFRGQSWLLERYRTHQFAIYQAVSRQASPE